tara:strand:+ start:697 stop:1053 length:357 start_codon:yes stop_codon:yes gene_type:complete
MRLGKKLKSGLRLGAKIGAGVIGTAGVIGAGLFALGSKSQVASSEGQNALENFNSGQGGIGSVSTADLDKLYPRPAQQASQTAPLANPRPRGGIGSGLTQAQKDRDQALIAMLNSDSL